MQCESEMTSTAWRRGPFRLRPRGPIFGQTYEDSAIELRVFKPQSRVLAIAGAGCTARALAAAGHFVTAVDINPRQLGYARRRADGEPARRGVVEDLLTIGRNLATLAGWRISSACRMGPSKLNTGIAGSIRQCGAPSSMHCWPLACSGSCMPVRLSARFREVSGSEFGSASGEAGACTRTAPIRMPRLCCSATHLRSSAPRFLRSTSSVPMRPNSSRTPRCLSMHSPCPTSAMERRRPTSGDCVPQSNAPPLPALFW
jgi:Protein of unknown function (DUF3419)